LYTVDGGASSSFGSVAGRLAEAREQVEVLAHVGERRRERHGFAEVAASRATAIFDAA
jgi:hypothetical protein